MENKWIDIDGAIEVNVDQDTFDNEFQKWLESKGWSFAGVTKLSEEA
jgi:hypothetical protein